MMKNCLESVRYESSSAMGSFIQKKKKWMHCLDVVCRFRLLYSKTVESTLVRSHDAQASSRTRIVVVSTVEVRRIARAAVEPNGPKVIRLAPVAANYWRHAVVIHIPEAHRPCHIQMCALLEEDTANIHQLLTLHCGRIHIVPDAQAFKIDKWQDIVVTIQLPQPDRQAPSHYQCSCQENVPVWLTQRLASHLFPYSHHCKIRARGGKD